MTHCAILPKRSSIIQDLNSLDSATPRTRVCFWTFLSYVLHVACDRRVIGLYAIYPLAYCVGLNLYGLYPYCLDHSIVAPRQYALVAALCPILYRSIAQSLRI